MTHRKKILVSGSNGQIGWELRNNKALNSQFHCIYLDRKELDLLSKNSICESFEKHKPDYFINAAAYTAVDRAEQDIEPCFLINDYALKIISESCKNHQCKLIHFSTDYVYHSIIGTPLKEADPKLPNGIYAQSKWAGEQKIINSDCEYIILRTSWVYSSHGKNFLKTIIRLDQVKDEISIVNDQIGTPTYASDIAQTIFQILQFKEEKIWKQTYNFSNLGQTNWFEWAIEIKNCLGLETKIKPIPSAEYPTAAQRPEWSVMDKSKIEIALDQTIPHWKEALKRCIALLNN